MDCIRASALIAFVACVFATETSAAPVANGGFEAGTFVGPSDPHYANFGGGTTSTVILPGETFLANWDVYLSPNDPTGAVDYPVLPRGMEWVDVTNGFAFDGTRFVDLNRGGDLFGISTHVATQPGSAYLLSYASTFGGKVRVMASGVGTPLNVLDVIPSDTTWRTYTHSFIADSVTTTLSFHATAVGSDPVSGAFIDHVSLVPEPSGLVLVSVSFAVAISFTRRRKVQPVGRN